jgi:hypothetical protein
MKQTTAVLVGQAQLSWPQVQSSEPGHHHHRAPGRDRPACGRHRRADQLDVHDRAGGHEFHQLAAGLEIQREDQASDLADLFPGMGGLAEWIVISPDRQELTLELAYSDRVRDPVAMHVGPVPDLQDVADGTSERSATGRHPEPAREPSRGRRHSRPDPPRSRTTTDGEHSALADRAIRRIGASLGSWRMTVAEPRTFRMCTESVPRDLFGSASWPPLALR